MNTQLLLIFLSIYGTTHYLEAMESPIASKPRPKPVARNSSVPALSSMNSWISSRWRNENKVAVTANNRENVAVSTRNSKSILKKPALQNIGAQTENRISSNLKTESRTSSKETLASKDVSFDETVQMIPIYQKEPFENLSQASVKRVLKSAPQTNLQRIEEPLGTFRTKVERPRSGLKIINFYDKNNQLIGRATKCNNPKGYPKNTNIIIKERLDGSTSCQILYPDSTVTMEYNNDILLSINYQNPEGFPLGTIINVIKTIPMSLTATMIEPATQESQQPFKIQYTIKYNTENQPISVKIKEKSRDQSDQISFNYNKKGDLQIYKNSTQDTQAELSFATNRKDQLDLYANKFNDIMKNQPSMPIIQ